MIKAFTPHRKTILSIFCFTLLMQASKAQSLANNRAKLYKNNSFHVVVDSTENKASIENFSWDKSHTCFYLLDTCTRSQSDTNFTGTKFYLVLQKNGTIELINKENPTKFWKVFRLINIKSKYYKMYLSPANDDEIKEYKKLKQKWKHNS
jgi:hypothetical protein